MRKKVGRPKLPNCKKVETSDIRVHNSTKERFLKHEGKTQDKKLIGLMDYREANK